MWPKKIKEIIAHQNLEVSPMISRIQPDDHFENRYEQQISQKKQLSEVSAHHLSQKKKPSEQEPLVGNMHPRTFSTMQRSVPEVQTLCVEAELLSSVQACQRITTTVEVPWVCRVGVAWTGGAGTQTVVCLSMIEQQSWNRNC